MQTFERCKRPQIKAVLTIPCPVTDEPLNNRPSESLPLPPRNRMRSETDTPVQERFLWFEGKVSRRAMEHIKDGLPADRPPQTELLFVGFAYADLPFGKRFDVVFPRDRPQDGVQCECRIVAATQQWGKPSRRFHMAGRLFAWSNSLIGFQS